MDEATFDQLARQELRNIEDCLADVDPDLIEVSVSDGVLRLDLRDKTRIVINAHRAASQIWMAAVSTAWHFDLTADGKWVAARTNQELRSTLRQVIAERIQLAVSLVDKDPPANESSPATTEATTIAVIRMWAAVAWADGKMTPAEEDGLRKLIASAPLSDEERAIASAFVAAPIAPDPFSEPALSPQVKAGVYRAACKMAKIDNIIEPRERVMLARLAGALGITDAVAKSIEAEIFTRR